MLEVHLLEKAIESLDEDRAAKLRALCDAMDAMDDHLTWVAANREFHRVLHEGAGAPLTVELVEQLGAQVERYLRLHGEGFDREREAGVEHRAILAAAVAGDVATASTHLRAHIDSTRRRVVATITATANLPEVTA